MVLSSLSLQNFRNFKKERFEFLPGVTIIVGPNTFGKTNILEAIYLLATGKSFRAEIESEIISYGEEISRLNAEVVYGQNKARIPHFRDDVRPQLSSQTNDDSSLTLRKTARTSKEKKRVGGSGFSEHSEMGIARLIRNEQNDTQLEIVVTTGQVAGKKAPKKQFLVNGVKKRMTDFIGHFFAVLFSPQDLQLITDSPSLRRKYLNSVLSCVDKEYRRALLVYEKALRQRNRILEMIREKRARFFQLEYWDRLLIKNGSIITEKRGEFIEFVNNKSRFLSQEIFKGLKVVYEKNEISEERLKEKQEREIILGMTLVGPHRDDLVVKLKIKEDRDLSIYGSRGEQRLAILWLKLGELAFLEEKTGRKPVLLLDDIFSELDKDRRDLVAQIIPSHQTIITTTEEKTLKRELLKEARLIRLTR